MRLNKRQKQLIIEAMAKEYKEVSNILFYMSLYDRKDKTGDFKDRWESYTKKKEDIITIVNMCNDDILKKVYFDKIVEQLEKEQNLEFQDFMGNR